MTVILLMFFINRVGLHYGFTARQLCHHHGTVTSMRSCLLFSSVGVTLAQFEVKMHIYHLTFLPISISSIHLRIHPWPLSYTNVTPDSYVIQFIYWKRTTLIDQRLQMAAKKKESHSWTASTIYQSNDRLAKASGRLEQQNTSPARQCALETWSQD